MNKPKSAMYVVYGRVRTIVNNNITTLNMS